ncbi:MAG: putative cytochrome hydroxylase [Nevskia sp.]|nr:putative cytochrome hydroxylase [Nevskia sp.]
MDAARQTSDIDLYSEAVRNDPYPHYRKLRDAGAAVWLDRTGVWAISRYKDVRESLRNAEVFSSAQGVAASGQVNEVVRGTTLCSDDPLHRKLRAVLQAPLTPAALAPLKGRIDAAAQAKVEELVSRGTFDAATDLARYLPLTIVTELVGLSEEGRERMLEWAAAGFDSLGAFNERAARGLAKVGEIIEYAGRCVAERAVKPGSWGAKVLEAADRGEITPQEGVGILIDYIVPSLDTTIFATAAMLWLFSRHPDQWEALRSDPSLATGALNETIRLESPITGFTRCVTREHTIEDVVLPAGSRALMLYASANRDERKWLDPERFDIRRPAGDHLGFGSGTHMCAGQHLARIEMRALLGALIRRVNRFELDGEVRRAENNVLRGLASVPIRVH